MLKLISVICFSILVYSINSYPQSNNNSVLLYSQTSNIGNYIISDYYGIGHNYNCQVADDFVATENWSVYQIIVFGQYTDGSADGFNIYFYLNNDDTPDSLVYIAANQAFSSNLVNYRGSFTITLENPAELMVGHYWISVQAIIDWNSYPYGAWEWRNIPGNYNINAVFRNSSGVIGCPSWSPASTCWNVLGTDMYFELYGTSSNTTVIAEDEINSPSTFELEQNYPNPFNPSTKIKFEIPAQGRNDNVLVTLKVYDVLGNEVATLVNEVKPAGSYEVNFDAFHLSSGIYFYKLQIGSFVETKKMVLLRQYLSNNIQFNIC